MKILVIEDNESVCSMLEMFFMKENFKGVFVHNGFEAIQIFEKDEWDLVIIDWMLPGMDGVTICRKIRGKSNVPIIMLTAKDSESDQVLGLEMGADDYVTKPFSPLTLMARIKAVTRRYHNNELPPYSSVIETRYFQLNKDTREVWLNDQKITHLTPKEFDLLQVFIENPRKVFTREQLLEKVWGYQFYGDERTVDVHIKRLRKKIATLHQPFIHTVWGVGYKFDEIGGNNES